MPPFPINPSAIPMVRTRKALMILDLQNDFLCREGALFTEEPEDYLERILEVAKAFRESGAGDVIWVRSEFESHRPLTEEGEQIITTDSMLRDRKTTSRGRQPTSTGHESAAMENDEEAFLSVGAKKDTRPCVQKGTKGAEFAPRVKAAIVPGRDIVFTKTHYSAFASGSQLVQMLRGRFVTQMYVCGALTNISIYATALGAGQHGYGVTLVEDCCGFRSTMRHLNAVRQLDHLAGCDVIGSENLLDELQPPTAPQILSTGLSPSISKIALELGSGSPDSAPAAGSPPSPAKPASPQRARDELKLTTPPRRRASNQSNSSSKGDRKRPLEDTGHLEAESDPSSSDRESTHKAEKKPQEARRSSQPPKAKRSELESSKGPTLSPGTGSTHAEKPRVVNRVKRRTQRTQPDKKPAPSSTATVATSDDAPGNTTKREPQALTTSSPTRPLTPEQKPSPHNMAEPPTSAVCGEALCEGDTHVITNLLPPPLAADGFERLLEEVSWASMSHMGGEVPRRIAVQGAVADDGSMPVYRHPADESPPLLPFSPTVLQIKAEVEKHLGHPLNHVLIQHYRTGNDYISEHSDKTLDIAPNSFIANVSLGAKRTMIFRTKRPPKNKHTTVSPTKAAATPPDNEEPQPQPQQPSPTTTTTNAEQPRQTHRASLPHNSLLRMGLRTNTNWLHAIRQDKRADRDRTPAERAFHGARISLTFRQIATFIDADQATIWGQGAIAKDMEGARPVVNGQGEEAVRLLRAFGAENNRSGGEGGFDWAEWYGEGFDVLHMGTPKRVFYSASSPSVGNVAVGLALAELGIGCAKGSVEGEVKFEDNDPGRTAVEGEGVVLRYLDAVYGAGRRYDQMLPGEVAKRFTRLQRGLELSGKWAAALREVGVQGDGGGDGEEQQRASAEQTKALAKLLGKELAERDGWAKEAATGEAALYIAGGAQPGPADFALWPVLHDVVQVCGEDVLGEHLRRYYTAFGERSSVAKALGQIKAE
ncbi:hypothetical protein CHGG_08426 [Chaetomium globosum CBS 148.51]|uniref:Fe2OG dioxygenase domain-containing protein n=1 Tax=Chaetomium globosum (strain ATCC 6205 / CBS 148.51 / DSM 1962 / NBRC 6347 / NRRL 1970) TaxID=306901 RepID=Q2GUC8_CHAGB|nr:uncharacterized protein CHGG_08426 [Chaetomium globosum CBS 148.51]EAQ84412.1 hypothetical protein CHGG_08426 [Chaetomium globosum CBS 148.51]